MCKALMATTMHQCDAVLYVVFILLFTSSFVMFPSSPRVTNETSTVSGAFSDAVHVVAASQKHR